MPSCSNGFTVPFPSTCSIPFLLLNPPPARHGLAWRISSRTIRPPVQEFSNLHLKDFSSITTYCQALKKVAERLNNVGARLRSTISLASHCRSQFQLGWCCYISVSKLAIVIFVRGPIPPNPRRISQGFSIRHRSHCCRHCPISSHRTDPKPENSYSSRRNTGRNSGSGKGKNNRQQGKGGNFSGGSHQTNRSADSSAAAPTGSAVTSPWGGYPPWGWGSWGPPCPYPTTPASRSSAPYRHQGIFGRAPPQAHVASAPAPAGPTATDIEAAMHTLGLTPNDPQWYMDTGATSHMTPSHGYPDETTNSEMYQHRRPLPTSTRPCRPPLFDCPYCCHTDLVARSLRSPGSFYP